MISEDDDIIAHEREDGKEKIEENDSEFTIRTRRPAKKEQLTPKRTAPKPKVLFSNISYPDIKLTEIVYSLDGIVLNEDEAEECTHLVTSNIDRTLKLLCSFKSCKYIISVNWLLDSKKAGTFLNERQYIIRNSSLENKYNFSLVNSLDTAAKRGTGIFYGCQFWIDPELDNYLPFEKMIMANDGQLLEDKPEHKLTKNIDHIFYIADPEQNTKEYSLSDDVESFIPEFVIMSILLQKLQLDKRYEYSKRKTNRTETVDKDDENREKDVVEKEKESDNE
eukprot:TRINITY_DN2381_c0_g1_i4.p1 TRINITY_DN2381_c0_g1~~TRINITY_DN2381_c0_g1_i4.p1  ORF type:complete len:279 (-),score=61.77 TRINITY_DN2381_c0_g1_i4:8-844(-)